MAHLEAIFKKTLVKIIAKEKLSAYKVDIQPLSSEGANFTSVLYTASISSSNRPTLQLFAKIAALPEVVRQQMPLGLIFEGEVSVYTNVLPAYEKLQEKYGIKEEERFKFPKYYGSNLEVMEETLVLENLLAQEYVMYDRFKSVTWEYASKVVEELAKFHALSLVYKKDHPEEYERYGEKSVYNQIVDSMFEVIKTPFLKMLENGMGVVDSDDLKSRMQLFAETQWTEENFNKYFKGSKWGFLVHGDFRASNILFKQEGGEIKHLIPVDYQGFHQGSPCMDLIYFIYSGTDEDFRKQHMQQLLDTYYNTLATFLTKFNINPEQTFTRQDFDEDFKTMLPCGLSTALSILPTILAPFEDVPNLENGIDAFAKVKPNEAFKKRLLAILDEFVGYGLL